MAYTTDELLDELRDDAQLSESAEDSQDTQLVRLLNREQRLFLTALIQRSKGKFKQATLDLTANGSTTRFNVPARAIAAGITMIEVVNSGGRGILYTLTDEEFASGSPKSGTFYIEGNQLVFHRAPPSSTLRVTYQRRLSKLVLAAEARAITAINTSTKTVTIAAAPSSFTGLTAMDLVKATPHFDVHGIDLACTAISSSGTSVVFSSTLPTNLAVGDYVCIPGESPVVQAPLELHRLLSLRAAYMWCRSKNDSLANGLKAELADAMRDAAQLLEPRHEQDPVLSNPNAPGWSATQGRVAGNSGVLP